MWTRWRRENPRLYHESNPGRIGRSLVTILTELPGLVLGLCRGQCETTYTVLLGPVNKQPANGKSAHVLQTRGPMSEPVLSYLPTQQNLPDATSIYSRGQRMRGVITLLPSTPSWRGAQFKEKAQEQLYLTCAARNSVTFPELSFCKLVSASLLKAFKITKRTTILYCGQLVSPLWHIWEKTQTNCITDVLHYQKYFFFKYSPHSRMLLKQ
jgi:hypothetical protein